MRVKFIKDEDFVNFKKPCMFIGTISCTFKCCKDANIPCSICQNFPWSKNPIITIDDDSLCRRYLKNPFIEESLRDFAADIFPLTLSAYIKNSYISSVVIFLIYSRSTPLISIFSKSSESVAIF